MTWFRIFSLPSSSPCTHQPSLARGISALLYVDLPQIHLMFFHFCTLAHNYLRKCTRYLSFLRSQPMLFIFNTLFWAGKEHGLLCTSFLDKDNSNRLLLPPRDYLSFYSLLLTGTAPWYIFMYVSTSPCRFSVPWGRKLNYISQYFSISVFFCAWFYNKCVLKFGENKHMMEISLFHNSLDWEMKT